MSCITNPYLGLALFISVLLPNLLWADGTLNFTFTITAPTCSVDVNPPNIAFNNGQPILPDEVGQQDSTGTLVQPFTLAINGCGNTAVYGQTPTMTVSGLTIADNQSALAPGVSSGDFNKLFADTTAAPFAKYVGFAICVNGTNHNCPAGSVPANLYSQSVAKDEKVALVATGAAMPASVAGWAQLSQGNISEPIVSGNMHASITFTASYQ